MAGTGFDDPGVYYSDSFFSEDRSEADGDLSRSSALKRFKEFLKTFLDQDNCFCYRYKHIIHNELCKLYIFIGLYISKCISQEIHIRLGG